MQTICQTSVNRSEYAMTVYRWTNPGG